MADAGGHEAPRSVPIPSPPSADQMPSSARRRRWDDSAWRKRSEAAFAARKAASLAQLAQLAAREQRDELVVARTHGAVAERIAKLRSDRRKHNREHFTRRYGASSSTSPRVAADEPAGSAVPIGWLLPLPLSRDEVGRTLIHEKHDAARTAGEQRRGGDIAQQQAKLRFEHEKREGRQRLWHEAQERRAESASARKQRRWASDELRVHNLQWRRQHPLRAQAIDRLPEEWRQLK